MAAFADLTINDGQATPVAHTFSARRIDSNGVAKWQDLSSGVAVGFPTILASIREPIRGSKIPVYKVTYKVVKPTLEVVNASTYNGITPAPTKAYECVGTVECLIPERSTSADRKDLWAYLYNGLNNATFKSMIQDLMMVF